jgi:hypothetical protein
VGTFQEQLDGLKDARSQLEQIASKAQSTADDYTDEIDQLSA